MDLSNSIIMPREDFIELTTTAFGQTTSTKERVTGTVQLFISCAMLGATFIAGMKVWKKDVLEVSKSQHEQTMTELNHPAYTVKK